MQRTPRHSDSLREGFTLLEVVIAVAILLGSITALFQLINIGHRSSIQGKFRSDAVLIAETRMNEAAGGVIELMSTTEEEVEDSPGWMWSMTVEESSFDDLLQVTVNVRRDATEPSARHEYSMTRYLRDPQMFLDAAVEE
jgi:type II secretion system protein I